MIKQTKIGIEIDVKAYLKEVKGYFYVILVYKNAAGKRKDKSFPTKLPVRGNKTKAKNMSEQILIDFEIPDEDLYMAAIASTEVTVERQVSVSIHITEDMFDKITLEDLTKEQIGNLLFADYLKLYLPYTRKRKKPIEDTTYSSSVSYTHLPAEGATEISLLININGNDWYPLSTTPDSTQHLYICLLYTSGS